MSDHAKLSPSKRGRWGKCPGSVREEAKYPETTSAAAIDGTHTHTLLEHCLKVGLYEAAEMVGTWMEDKGGKFLVDKERAERVQMVLDYVKSRKEELVSKLTETSGVTTAIIQSERKIDLKNATGRDDMSGTADFIIGSLEHGVFEIGDLKDGINPVAPDSLQHRQYAAGEMANLHPDNLKQIKTLRLTVIQPKAAIKGGQAVKFVDLDAVEFMATEPQKLIAEAAATDDPNAPLVPGDEQCKYCKHKGACAALTNQMMEKSGIVFANLDVAKEAANKEPTELSDEQIKELVEAAPLLRSMLESVEAEALRRMESGKVIAGLKVVRGRGSRVWAFEEVEMAEKLKKFGLTKGDIYPEVLISPAQAEKVIKTKSLEKGKDPEKKLKTLSDEYVKKTDGKMTVALESDPRPAVTLNVAPMFGAISEVPDWLK